MTEPVTIKINEVEYVRKDTMHATPEMAGDYVIVRSRDAGVFAGHLVSRDGTEVQLTGARRIWQWSGAATLSQLAVDGTSNPGACKFPVAVPSIVVLGVCEVIDVSAKAKASIEAVKVWEQ